jgi:hypothetical protein
MMSDDIDEARREHLAGLPFLASDQKRAERTRRLCRARLDRQRSVEHVISRVDIVRRGLGPVVVSAFCAFYIVYVSALVALTLRLRGLLH